MIYFAILHRPSGRYLPSGGKKRRGHTHQEPISLEERPPRLFIKKAKAKQALDYWLQGKWCEHFSAGGPDYEPDYDLAPKKVASRKAEDMEVVSFELVPQVRT